MTRPNAWQPIRFVDAPGLPEGVIVVRNHRDEPLAIIVGIDTPPPSGAAPVEGES